MRTTSRLVGVSLFALACADPSQPAPQPKPTVALEPSVEPPPASPVAAPAAVTQAASPSDLPPSEQPLGEPPPADPSPADPSPADPTPSVDVDPLTPILPSGPEPGTPEADAELAKLLDESTLTQDEFDAAFRGTKPKIEGDQFVFGPGDRTRKAPVVTIGAPTITGSKLAPSELTKLAKADQRGFEGCLAVALVDDPTTRGSVTLKIEFDAAGASGKVTVDGSLDAPLRECLAAVADDWKLAAAAKASVGLPLSLTSE